MLSKKNVKKLRDHGIDLVIKGTEKYPDKHLSNNKLFWEGGERTCAHIRRINDPKYRISLIKDTGTITRSSPGFEALVPMMTCECCKSEDDFDMCWELNEEEEMVGEIIKQFKINNLL